MSDSDVTQGDAAGAVTHLQAALLVDESGQVLYATEHPGSHRLNVKRVLGRDWLELFAEFEQVEIESTTRPETFFFIGQEKPDGAYRVRTWGAAPLPGTGGGQFVMVEAVGDPAAVDELIHHERMIALGQIAAGVAHEVNNPLTTISGWLQILLAETSPEEKRRAPLQLMSEEATRIAQIIQHLLEFGRRVPSEERLVPVERLLRDVLALVDYQMRGDNIEVAAEFDPALPYVMGDANQLKQVFLNIVINARQAMPKGGRLGVTTRRGSDGAVEALISDTGPGMTPDVAQRIFEPFFTTKIESGGSGLGLFLCQSIVKEHKGTLTVSSRPGEGSVFVVRLPAVSDAVVESREPEISRTASASAAGA